jgi:PAS domain S-box-containing protein
MSDPHQLMAASQPLWEASADGLVLVDTSGKILATNSALLEMFGYEAAALDGRPVEMLVSPDVRDRHVRLREEFERTPVARPMAESRNLEGLRSDGSTFPINVSLGQLATASGTHSFATVRDLTERLRVEAEAAEVRRQHGMALERERIAHDLHDNVIQRLFALGLTLEGLPPRIDTPDVAGKVFSAVDTIDDIIDDLRSTIYGLRNRISSHAPLRDRIFAVIDEMQPSLGFAPSVSITGEFDALTDEAITEHLLAVLREALSNTARHANASEARVTLSITDDEVELSVIDNGVGFRDDVRRSGLANLAARAVELDGSFEVRRHTPDGTLLRWVGRAAPHRSGA